MLRAFLFQLLMFLRGIVRLPLRIAMAISALCFVSKLVLTGLSDPGSLASLAVVFVVTALARHYYDELLFAVAPEGRTLYLPR